MTEFTQLAVGKPYPIKLPYQQEGAAANFLLKGGNILQILLSGLSDDELWSLKKGEIKGGFLYRSGCILWLFAFSDRANKPVFTFDCPFDARIIPKDDLVLHSIDNSNERLAIEIHVIDENLIVRALRLITLSNQMTINFLSAVQEQLSVISDESAYLDWMQHQPKDLIKTCNSESLGSS